MTEFEEESFYFPGGRVVEVLDCKIKETYGGWSFEMETYERATENTRFFEFRFPAGMSEHQVYTSGRYRVWGHLNINRQRVSRSRGCYPLRGECE